MRINSYPYYQDKKERKNKSLLRAFKLHKIVNEGGEKMKIIFTLSNANKITENSLTYEEAVEIFEQEGKHIEIMTENPHNGKEERIYIVKSHIVKIEEDLSEEK